MKLLLSSWMKELDAEAIDNIGIPAIVLMENASRGAAKFFAAEFPREKNYKNIIVMAGKGNNGGDGMAVGRILHQQGYLVQFLLLFDPDQLNTDPKINFNIIKKLNLHYTVVQNETHLEEIFKGFNPYPKNETVIIDALFGTGLNNPIKEGIYARAIRLMTAAGFKVAAVDIPSGLSDAFLPGNGEGEGEGPSVVTADVTATFQCLKTAHLYPDGDGSKYCGKIQIIDIGIPWERVNRDKYYIHIITPDSFNKLLEKPGVDAHKGDFGHALTVAGSVDKPGAGILSSFAVLRAGAGLCTTAVSYENRTAVVTAHPEIMTLVYKGKEDLFPALKPFDCIMAGPGMGNNRETFEIVSRLLQQAGGPLVLDADALNALQGELKLLEKPTYQRRHPLIITPHPGEFARLTGLSSAEIRRARIDVSREFALRYNVFVVLKGHHTIIATPGGRVFVNPTGNPGMATAGSGDVLSGIITGLICRYIKKYDLETILQAAVFIHGFAGDLAARKTGEISLTAGDIIDHIPAAFLALEKNDYQLPFNIS
jgi:NAD(P)H-hydrate epimerase